MKIRWEVEDGYAGKSRPHFITIDDDEFEDMDEAEKQEYIEQCVQEEFEQHCYPTWEIVG